MEAYIGFSLVKKVPVDGAAKPHWSIPGDKDQGSGTRVAPSTFDCLLQMKHHYRMPQDYSKLDIDVSRRHPGLKCIILATPSIDFVWDQCIVAESSIG